MQLLQVATRGLMMQITSILTTAVNDAEPERVCALKRQAAFTDRSYSLVSINLVIHRSPGCQRGFSDRDRRGVCICDLLQIRICPVECEL
mmetsp:Transcript_7606/g.13474  ORF Transcript_7606/g.13474 Transcript_7606/m.13474 type:complete len:90 (+) Transcript_7606:325-594(+)